MIDTDAFARHRVAGVDLDLAHLGGLRGGAIRTTTVSVFLAEIEQLIKCGLRFDLCLVHFLRDLRHLLIALTRELVVLADIVFLVVNERLVEQVVVFPESLVAALHVPRVRLRRLLARRLNLALLLQVHIVVLTG